MAVFRNDASVQRFRGTEGADQLILGPDGGVGNDVVRGWGGNDTLRGGRGNDALYGGRGNDVLIGGSGLDRLDGGRGWDIADFSDLGAGLVVDLARGLAGREVLVDIEMVRGTGFADRLLGSPLRDHFDGGRGNDTVFGGNGSDRLDGGAGSDVVWGGNGDDILCGGTGADDLRGGSGEDIFLFRDGTDSPASQRDRIRDFVPGEDVIDLGQITDASGAVTSAERRCTFRYIGAADFSGARDEVRFEAGVLEVDTNRDGVADLAVRIEGILRLAASDFDFLP